LDSASDISFKLKDKAAPLSSTPASFKKDRNAPTILIRGNTEQSASGDSEPLWIIFNVLRRVWPSALVDPPYLLVAKGIATLDSACDVLPDIEKLKAVKHGAVQRHKVTNKQALFILSNT
jgi:hypothetical protein